MSTATVHCHAELNDFLPVVRKDVAFTCSIVERSALKDLLESLGVPHTEIALLIVNGTSVGFSYPVRDNDQIDAYPVYAKPDIAIAERVVLRPAPPSRFVLDTHLGKLAANLRMLGFDTLYSNDCDDATLAHISHTEDRVLLTRDLGLLKRGMVTHGYFVRAPPTHSNRSARCSADSRCSVRSCHFIAAYVATARWSQRPRPPLPNALSR